MSIFGLRKSTMVTPQDALPGREQRPSPVPARHEVLGTPVEFPAGIPEGLDVVYVGMGCFWGAERRMWQLPGVYSTAVGYQGGFTPNPTYAEVCTGRTGHTEAVQVVYDPDTLDFADLLKVFWENHDPTQGYRQGNDVGTQYRSTLYFTTPEQEELAELSRERYQTVLTDNGLDPITTQVTSAEGLPFYYAEPEHQQYLAKNPHGYDCHANTGFALPSL